MTKPDLEALARAAHAAHQEALQVVDPLDADPFASMTLVERQAWMLAAGAVESLVLDHVLSRIRSVELKA